MQTTPAGELSDGTNWSWLMIPASREPTERALGSAVASRDAAESVTGELTVLVVEDEAVIRRVVAETLSRAGYHVLQAGDPIVALEIAGAQRGKIDLLLTDVVMPHMSGLELAKKVTAADDHVRVLFMSGYGAPTEDGSYFIAKPIRATTLLAAVGDACQSA